MAEPTETVHVTRVDLIERFAAVLYPVELTVLLERLPEQGWVVQATISGGEVLADRELATKGNVQLVVDTGNKLLGVRGNHAAETLEAYRELRAVAQEISRFTPNVSTDYVEIRYRGWTERGANPTEVFASWWSKFDKLSSLGAIVGKRLPAEGAGFGQYGVRMTPVGQDANRQTWAELQIIPHNIAGLTRYHFDLVYRHPESSIAEKVVEDAEALVGAVLAHVENA